MTDHPGRTAKTGNLTGIYLLVVPIRRWVPANIPWSAFAAFMLLAVGLQTWHGVEHSVIIANILANSGCPCPGILDVALGTSDTVLHFFYDTITFAGLVIPFWYLRRNRA